MASTPGKQHIDLIRHRELNALRRAMAQRTHNSLPILTVAESSEHLPQPHIGQKIAEINALEAQMTSIAPSNFGEARTQFNTQSTVQAIKSINTEQNEIHTAAVYFANQRIDEALQILEQSIQPQGNSTDHVSTWLALLDLYRATGRAVQFDTVALDFSIRFGRSTPSWVAIEQPRQQAQGRIVWTAPRQLNRQSIASLDAIVKAHSAAQPALVLDWRDVSAVDPTSWQTLHGVLGTIAQTSAEYVALGTVNFMQFLNMETSAAAQAKLAWIRCQNLVTDFEDAAIDYCTAFEMSPPDWIAPACRFTITDELLFSNATDNTLLSEDKSKRTDTSDANLALVGEIIDTLPPSFQLNDAQIRTIRNEVQVSCEHLVRCNPLATLQLRDWASALHAQGISVTLLNVHRLISAYFLSQGIFAFAKVTTRKD